MDKDENNYTWSWCLIGNIVEKHIYGEEHEIRYGSKHFSGGTKVSMFCVIVAQHLEIAEALSLLSYMITLVKRI